MNKLIRTFNLQERGQIRPLTEAERSEDRIPMVEA